MLKNYQYLSVWLPSLCVVYFLVCFAGEINRMPNTFLLDCFQLECCFLRPLKFFAHAIHMNFNSEGTQAIKFSGNLLEF